MAHFIDEELLRGNRVENSFNLQKYKRDLEK